MGAPTVIPEAHIVEQATFSVQNLFARHGIDASNFSEAFVQDLIWKSACDHQMSIMNLREIERLRNVQPC